VLVRTDRQGTARASPHLRVSSLSAVRQREFCLILPASTGRGRGKEKPLISCEHVASNPSQFLMTRSAVDPEARGSSVELGSLAMDATATPSWHLSPSASKGLAEAIMCTA